MWQRVRAKLRFRPRDVIVVLTLVSHLFATFGFPLPPASSRHKDASTPYPCQSRPCGCLTSEQCWAGDCCCFTLEEKITWAEEHGVEPPAHVRPLAASRTARPPAPAKKPRRQAGESAPAPNTPTCCEQTQPAAPACCRSEPEVVVEAPTECPHCSAKSAPTCRHEEPAPSVPTGVRWVVGIFAQKCRGEGPAGLFQLDPAVVPDPTPLFLTGPDRPDHDAPRSERVASLTHSPPTRPPRPF